jgi:hypothetical protein
MTAQRVQAAAVALEAALPPTLALAVTPLGLQLERRVEGAARRRGGTPPPAPLRIDFTAPALLARYASMVRAGDALLDACLAPLLRQHGHRAQSGTVDDDVDDASAPFTLLDCTAGLGRDGAALAYAAHARRLPLRVVLCEAHPVVAALLEDGLRRGAAGGLRWLQPDRLALLHADAADVLRSLAAGDAGGVAQGLRAPGDDVDMAPLRLQRPHVVYADPMFTETTPEGAPVSDGAAGDGSAGNRSDARGSGEAAAPAAGPQSPRQRRRTAAPQRELQYLAEVVGPAAPAATARLLAAALAAASERVVVKRHHGAPAMGTVTPAQSPVLPRPSHALPSGKAVRYDVYGTRRDGDGPPTESLA